MWMNGVASLVRQGLRWPLMRRRRRRRTARVVDESALQAAAEGAGAGGEAVAVVATASVGAALARLALACTVRFDGGEGTEEAWAASAWRPRADEVSHLMVRDSMRYAIYA